jgi:hypothetical protein
MLMPSDGSAAAVGEVRAVRLAEATTAIDAAATAVSGCLWTVLIGLSPGM